jgi:preprotein translocase subunit YajC
MFISKAFAQAAPGAPAAGGLEFIYSLAPFIVIFIIMYFLIIRPQRQRMKQHQAMISAVKRNDTVVTAGGLIGKVTKVVDDNELEVKFGENQPVRVVRSTVTEVRAKPEPAANAND